MSTFDTNEPYGTDIKLLQELGLKRWTGKTGVEIHLGDVYPYRDEESPQGDTVISVFVIPLPAQAYRFEITKPSEMEGHEGMETVTMRTGTGQLATFWPLAMSVATSMIEVSAPRPAIAGQPSQGK